RLDLRPITAVVARDCHDLGRGSLRAVFFLPQPGDSKPKTAVWPAGGYLGRFRRIREGFGQRPGFCQVELRPGHGLSVWGQHLAPHFEGRLGFWLCRTCRRPVCRNFPVLHLTFLRCWLTAYEDIATSYPEGGANNGHSKQQDGQNLCFAAK